MPSDASIPAEVQAAASRANRRADLCAVYGNLNVHAVAPYYAARRVGGCSDWRAVRWGNHLSAGAALRPSPRTCPIGDHPALESRVAHESLPQTPHRRIRRSSTESTFNLGHLPPHLARHFP